MGKKEKRTHSFRPAVQALWTVLTNMHLSGFITGKIYQGKLKHFCVPGLNCYSCPGALGACPIGALQAVVGHWKFRFSFYVTGFLIFTGALLGRLVCGFLCPFGFFQELLNRIPFPVKLRTFRGDRLLRKLKYVVLVVFVLLLPLFLTDFMGQGEPYFCKLLCPAGMLEGGLPLVLLNRAMQGAVGWLYTWKAVLLAATVLTSVLIYRPFCKYLCPLGAVYSVFNPVAAFRYQTDAERCTRCGACAAACPMGVDPAAHPNDPECIRCGKCIAVCGKSARKLTSPVHLP